VKHSSLLLLSHFHVVCVRVVHCGIQILSHSFNSSVAASSSSVSCLPAWMTVQAELEESGDLTKGVRTSELQRGLKRLASDPWLALGLQPPPDNNPLGSASSLHQQPTEAELNRLKRAWRRLALKYHPDKTQNRTSALFATIQVCALLFRTPDSSQAHPDTLLPTFVPLHSTLLTFLFTLLSAVYSFLFSSPSFIRLPRVPRAPSGLFQPPPNMLQAAYTQLSDPTARAAHDAARKTAREDGDRRRRNEEGSRNFAQNRAARRCARACVCLRAALKSAFFFCCVCCKR